MPDASEPHPLAHGDGAVNPEVARRQAQLFAQQEDAIVALVHSQAPGDGTGTFINGLRLSRFDGEGRYPINEGESITIIAPKETLNIGGKGVIFNHYSDDYKSRHAKSQTEVVALDDINKAVGVSSRRVLKIGIHTDFATDDAVRKFLGEKPENIALIGSQYYFDSAGNYAKVVELPVSISDDRPSIGEESHKEAGNSRYVKAIMSPGDFELVAGVLSRLNERLTPPKSDPTES